MTDSSPTVCMHQIEFDLKPLPPYRLDLTAWCLKRRTDNTWDRWDTTTQTYSRLLVIDGVSLDTAVTQSGSAEAPVIHVTAGTAAQHEAALTDVLRQRLETTVRGLLGVDVDLTRFHEMAATDPKLSYLGNSVRGLHPPRYSSLFEALTNAITCQQITLTAGLRILGRLAATCGARLGGAVSFPLAENVARLSAQDLIRLGYSRQKARAMVELSVLTAEGDLDQSSITDLSDKEAVDRLCQLFGVGRWSAEYTLLRGDGRLGVFPGDDVGVRRHLEEWLGLKHRLDYDGVKRVLETWCPFGGMIYLHLLTASLADSGHVTGNEAVETE